MPTRQLKRYRDKRLSGATPEPFGQALIPKTGKLFVVQQHQARHLHWDLRLEMDGVLHSWAVPKGPSRDQRDKRFAAQVEDHPLDYANFEGRIPEDNYGAGYVIVWDKGTWTPIGDTAEGLRKGKLLFDLNGFKLHGRWTLVRIKDRKSAKSDQEGKSWLFIKERDEWMLEDAPYSDQSVFSGLTLAEFANPAPKVRRLVSAARRIQAGVTSTDLVRSRPMLATAGEPFDRKDWLFELKYDGYRIMAEKDDRQVVLRSRNGHDLTSSFPEIALHVSRLPLARFVLDGELVVHNAHGVPDFSCLQRRARLVDELAVARAAIELPCCYYAFDALQIDDVDLREATLEQRKALLKRILPDFGAIRYSEHVRGKGIKTYQTAVQLGLEGMVGKRANSPYQPGRSAAWVKVRQQRSGDFVVAGWSPGRGNPDDIGAIALGEYRDGELHFVGRAGSGLNAGVRRELTDQLSKLSPAAAPHHRTGTPSPRTHWLQPSLVCEVAYKEYTRDGHLRHPVFLRLRFDKPPAECTGHFDDPTGVTLRAAPEPDVTVTHKNKIFFPEAACSKGDLVSYYEAIAPWMLRYLADRPIVLTRFPDGIHGKSFYQRDAPDFVPEWIQREVLWSEGADREVHYFIVQSTAALKYLANLGTIPIHLWHSRITDLAHPDWCVLDLDPKTAPFRDVVTLARAVGELCDELELPSYPKTSGATGLHVLVPLARQLTHDHARSLGELIARVIVSRYPDIATIARSVKARKNRVYLDYLQNGQGRLLAAPFSARAEAAASVSMPLAWGEVNGRLSNARFHLKNAARRMRRRKEDPLANVLQDEPDLPRALHRLSEIIQDTDGGV